MCDIFLPGIAVCDRTLDAHSCHLRISCVLDYSLGVKFRNSISLKITAVTRYTGVTIR